LTLLYPEVGVIRNSLGITIGSGVLIGPDTILTCFHVVTPWWAWAFPPLSFTPTYSAPRILLKVIQVPGSNTNDLGIGLIFPSVFEVSPATIKREQVKQYDPATIVGCGEPSSGIKTSGSVIVNGVDYTYRTLNMISNSSQYGRFGDSGGGVYSSTGKLIGIMYSNNSDNTTFAHDLSCSYQQTAIDSQLILEGKSRLSIEPPQCSHVFGSWEYVSSYVRCRACTKCGYKECY
jgi:hypothetical protein